MEEGGGRRRETERERDGQLQQAARKRPSYRKCRRVGGSAWEPRARSNESTETINSPAEDALEKRRDADQPSRSNVWTTNLSGCPPLHTTVPGYRPSSARIP